MFKCRTRVTVTAEWDTKGWLSNARNKLFLIDDAEECIEKRLLDLTSTGFKGLAALKKVRTFLFTATLTDYHKACWKAVFGMPEEAIHKFPSTHEVQFKDELKQDVRLSLRRNKGDMMEAAIEKITRVAQEKPVLLFIAKDDE